MDIILLEKFFLYMFAMNFGLLLFWSLMLLGCKNWVFSVHKKFLPELTTEDMSKLHYQLLGFYKIIIYGFMLFPYISLRILG